MCKKIKQLEKDSNKILLEQQTKKGKDRNMYGLIIVIDHKKTI